jgi:uncharacterized membrane protein
VTAPSRPRPCRAAPLLLGALLAAAGVLHLLVPRVFDGIVPDLLPHPRAWTYASGVVELACAAAVLRPATRARGGLATAVLFVAVFPANVQQALHTDGAAQVVALLRLPLQVPLVLWALQVRRAADGRPTAAGPAG